VRDVIEMRCPLLSQWDLGSKLSESNVEIPYSKGKFRNQSKTLIPREGPPDALSNCPWDWIQLRFSLISLYFLARTVLLLVHRLCFVHLAPLYAHPRREYIAPAAAGARRRGRAEIQIDHRRRRTFYTYVLVVRTLACRGPQGLYTKTVADGTMHRTARSPCIASFHICRCAATPRCSCSATPPAA